MAGIQQGLAWSLDLETGDERVDSQHRRIFDLLNDLIAACADGSEAKRLRETLDFLVEYTIRHFTDEELLQLQYDFPEYKKHKRMHDELTEQVVELIKRFEASGSSAELSRDVNRVVVAWLVGHISREDKKIAEHIRSLSAGGEALRA